MPETSSIPGLRDLWRLTLGDPRVCVAVLDGPAVLDHPCLRGANVRRLRSYWLDDGADVEDGLVEHATHVCSVLFSPHDTDVLGLAPRCRGLSIAVQTGGMTDAYNVVRALDAARDAGAHIIHVAVVQPTQSGTAENLLERAVRTCLDEGILVVSPAGNDRGECWTMPSAIPGVLAVGAMNDEGQPFQFSNYGGILQSQGVLAPGENILGADSTNGGTWKQKGTSCAAPIVTGVAALLMSLQLRQGRKPSAAEVRQAILDTAIPCDPREVDEPERCLRGKLNIPGATEAILGSAPAHHAGTARRTTMSVTPSGEARSGDRAARPSTPIRPDNQASTSGTGRVVRASGPAAQILVPCANVNCRYDKSETSIRAFESTDAFIPIYKTYFVGTTPHDQVVPRDDRIDHHAITDPGQAREAPRADPAAHDGGRRVRRRGGPREHPLPPHPRGQLQRPAGASGMPTYDRMKLTCFTCPVPGWV